MNTMTLVTLLRTAKGFQDADLYHAPTQTLNEVDKCLCEIATELVNYKRSAGDTVNELMSSVDLFTLITSLVQLYSYNEMIQERNKVLSLMLPLLLVSFLCKPELFIFIASRVRSGEFQNNLYGLCLCLDVSLSKLGILLFANLPDCCKADRAITSTMLFTVIPNLKICNDCVGSLANALAHQPLDNDLIYAALLDTLSLSSQSTRELLALLLVNDPEGLLNKLEEVSNNPEITHLNANCISKVYEVVLKQLIFNGVELPNILKLKLTNRSFLKFSCTEADSVTSSLSFIMESVENNLDILDSISLLSYYFLSMKRLRLAEKSELYKAFNLTHCKISLTSLILYSIYRISSLIINRFLKLKIPDNISEQFKHFSLPPIAKSNYLFDNLMDTDCFNIDLKLANISELLNCCIKGLILSLDMMSDNLDSEFRALNYIEDQTIGYKLRQKLLNRIFAGIFNLTFALFGLFVVDRPRNTTPGHERAPSSTGITASEISAPGYNAASPPTNVDNIAIYIFKLIIKKIFQNLFTPELLSNSNSNLNFSGFVVFAEELCESDLNFIEITDSLLLLVDSKNFLDESISGAMLTRLLNRFDPQCKMFTNVREGLKIPICGTIASENFVQFVEVTISDFDSLYGESPQLDFLNNELSSTSIGSNTFSSFGMKRNDSFAAKDTGKNKNYLEPFNQILQSRQTNSGRPQSIHVDRFK